MNKSTILNLIVASLMILLIGLSAGFSLGYFQARKLNFNEFQPVKELNPYISTIKLLKYENGSIYGHVEGQKTRLAYNLNDIKDLEPGDTFEIPLSQISLGAYYGAKELPENANYISSKSGKYFYHVLDPRALRITPKNRQYFQSEEEALNAGFIPPK